MGAASAEALDVALRVNWYTDPAQVVADEPTFLSQIMARGCLHDLQWMLNSFPTGALEAAYRQSPPGLFSRRGWAYWGLMLLGDTKALPYPVRFPDMPLPPGLRWPGH